MPAAESTQTDQDSSLLDGYAPPQERPPLLSYGLVTVFFNALVAAALLLIRRSDRYELPERVGLGDFLLIGVGSHKVSRLITKEKITSFARAPFTELQEKGGPAELEEAARGTGVRRAIGELLVCPYCVGLWIVAAMTIGIAVAPRFTRFVATVFSALALSDFLQIAYKAAEEKGL